MHKISIALALAALAPTMSPLQAAPLRAAQGNQQRMDDVATSCLIDRRAGFVHNWLNTLSGSSAERKLVRPMEADFTACFNGGPWTPMGWAPTYHYPGMRRALIAMLLRPSLANLPAEAPSGLARPLWFSPEEAKEPNAAASLLANNLGFCLARSDWASTRALLISDAGSKEEKAALAGVIPHIAGCVPPGRKLAIDRESLRSTLNETVYHAIRN